MAHTETAETQRAHRRFVKAAMSAPLLEAEREQALAKAWRDEQDEAALHELTEAYMRLVVSMASRFRHYGLPVSDLVQEGCVGLMQAAARFEPAREVRFSTYAAWWIRSAMQDYVLRNWSIVRTGTTAAHKALFFNLRRLRALIDRGAQPRLSPDAKAEIAKALNVSEKDVDVMEGRLAAADRSLNARVGEDGEFEWMDLLADDRQLPEEDVISRSDTSRRTGWLHDAIGTLSEREQTIIRERHMVDEPSTLEALGKVLGISKERVRQLEAQAMKKLRTEVEKHTAGSVAAPA